ncbi:5'-nucleotidase [Sutterella sp.]|uniref:5'-nucleotidase n=1 Tax=Sutterella sp. TaxID=1981025 RepID=UPI0026E0C0F5|nr:5'-nucleotidase [Sutterella sp.]MDO5530428.1 5'-nucleotidase [Sutterella sp.]
MANPNEQLVVAVSSRALFDLEQEHRLFEEQGYAAFRDYQVKMKDEPLAPGVAFPFVKRLLGLNKLFPGSEPFRVVALSRNSPETARRFFSSCRHHQLPIHAGAFTSGQSTFPFISAFRVSLFLSANPANVTQAIEAGLPGGLVLPSAVKDVDDDDPTLRIAFDFDGVLADDEAERRYQAEGLKGFTALELEKAATPHSPGPLRGLFEKLSRFQRLDYEQRGRTDPYFKPAIRISIVTSRGAPSEERLITTLKSFGMSAAELFLLDGLDKKDILQAIRPHIFFDDQLRHLEKIQTLMPSVLVPFGVHNQHKNAP